MRLLKRYPKSRKLYDTSTGTWVRLSGIVDLVRADVKFTAVDFETGEDITYDVLVKALSNTKDSTDRGALVDAMQRLP